jgi:Fe-S-cluster containining protein
MQAVLKGESDADVPCDGCTGCCVSSYAIALRPDDKVALAAVPARHLRLPVNGGLALMGYRADGSCPMLEAGRCTIYADRPQTCRDYDCRIYAATGLSPDGSRPVIEERVREWRFDFTTEEEAGQHEALHRAARFIHEHGPLFPAASKVHSAVAVAVFAVKAWPLFLHEKGDGSADPSPGEMARRVLEAASAFDHG